jgi:RNA polymerase sigma-70 factor (ECF subfamily)
METEEFKSLVLPFKDKLFRLADTMLDNRPESEDVIQDVYLKLWNMRAELSKYNSVEAFAVTVTKNLCIDKLRSYRSKNQNEDGLEQIKIPSEINNPEYTFELKESLQQVHEIIRTLPKQQSVVLHLRDIEQYSYDEIEGMTGLSRNNIRVTLSRARKKMREKYLEKYHYEKRED